MDWRKIAENRNKFWLDEKKLREELEAQLSECQRQRDAAVEALKDANNAIKSLEEDALGWGMASDRYRWPLRTELLNKIEKALALCDHTDNMPKVSSS